MNRKIGNGFFLFAILIILFGKCDGATGSGSDDENDVSDGMAGINLNIQGSLPAASSGKSAVTADLDVLDTSGISEGKITLSEARLNIYQIELEMDDNEIDSEEEQDQEQEIEYTGPFVIDLLNNSTDPEIPYIELLPGSYDEIKLKLAKVESDHPTVDSGDPLYGNSIYMEGTYTGATLEETVTDMPVILSIALDEEFTLQADGEGMVLDEGVINELIIAYRLAIWFRFDNPDTNEDSVEFGDVWVEDDGDGGFHIVLDETGSNAPQWDVIMENVKASTDFGEDEDDNGELDDDEDSDDDSDED